LVIGFTAGVIAGLTMNILDLVLHLLNIPKLLFLDWAAITIYGSRPDSLQEAALAFGVQLFFGGLLGIVFAYLLPLFKSRYHLFKGFVFGVTAWFVIHGLVIMFNYEGLRTISFATALTDLIGSAVFGVVVAFVFKQLHDRVTV
jgi:hypothetical protein